jgi:LytS/YehU family sensor histidine kinase
VIDRRTLRRYSAAAAIFWPAAGLIIQITDSAIAYVLGQPAIGHGAIWAVVGWLMWSVMAPVVVGAALVLRGRFRGAKLAGAHCVMAAIASVMHSAVYFVVKILISGQPGTGGESVLEAWIGGLGVTLELDILVYVLTVAGVHAALALRSMEEQERESEELQRLIGRAELELLKMQIPERLLMTMFRQIETLVVSSMVRAEILINQLSRLLRSALAFAVAKKTFKDEVVLAQNFASAATAIRKAPFLVDVRVPDETSAALPVTKLVLPLLVSVWSDTAEDESPAITIDAVHRGNTVMVIWTVTGVRDPNRLRSLAETVRVRLPETESISDRRTSDGLVIAYERPAETDEEALLSRSLDSAATPAPPPRRRPPIVTWVALLALYPPLEAFIAGLIAVAAAAMIGGPLPSSPFAEAGPAAIATPAGFALAWIAWRRRHRPQRGIVLFALAIGAIILPLVCLTIASAAIALFQPRFLDVLREQIASSYRTDDFLIFFGIAVGTLAYGRQLASEERHFENQALDEQLARTHAQVLRDQLNPHFVFNALNSILALADRDRMAAGAMTARLRQYFELVTGMAERQQVSLQEELRLTETYLDIEKVRFGERLKVSIDVQPAALPGLVPNLLLQPLIENAVRHGLEPKQGGSVFIVAERQKNDLLITVRDDGPGLRVPPRQEGIGLQNVRNRLKQLHGRAFSMDANDRSNGFSVSIRLPFRAA